MTKRFCDECDKEMNKARPAAGKEGLVVGKYTVKFKVTTGDNIDRRASSDDPEDEGRKKKADLCVPCLARMLNLRALKVLKTS
jgi:hypothetical protein